MQVLRILFLAGCLASSAVAWDPKHNSSTSSKHSTSTSSKHSTTSSTTTKKSTTTTKTSSATCKPTIATFDDIKALPGLSELTKIGIYQSLNFTGFDVLVAGVLGQGAVAPQSGTQTAANGNLDDLTSSPAIYKTSSIKSFDLQYLYFGCVLDTEETFASAPQDCTLSFTAFKEGVKSAFQTLDYSFTPGLKLINVPMVMVTFPDTWTKLEKVEIAIVSATSGETLAGVLMDNVAHCNHV